MRKLIILLIAVLLPLSLHAQQKQRVTEEVKSPAQVYDEDMASPVRAKGFPENFIQYGGWITPTFYDQWNKSQTLISDTIDLRLWMKAYIKKDIFVYLRAKDYYTGIIKSKNYGDLDKHDNQVDLDMAYAGFSTPDRSINVFAGRKFFIMGTGLVLSGRGDGAQFDYYSPVVNFSVIGMYTGLLAKENNPYNLGSLDNSDGAKRTFTGINVFRTILNQTVYAFVLAQFDNGKNEADEKTEYNSQYWGVGSKGVIGENLSYYGEVVYETGKSKNVSGGKERISAFAVNSEFDYYLKMRMNPTVIFQYAMGSGDKDRSGKDPNGNISDKDTGFLYFGTFTGGYALRPYLMNIHVLRGGFSIAPVPDYEKLYLNRMFVIFKYSLYLKHKKDKPLADSQAGEKNIFVGHGPDLSFKWIIYSDISVFLNGAAFIPVSAYSSNEKVNQYFVFSGFNFAF